MTTTDSDERTDAETAPHPAAALGRTVAWLCVVGGTFGLAGSVALTLEKINTLANPDYIPSCSLNPIVSCGTVMSSPQGSLFGFPNSLIGIGAFGAVIAIGVALLSGYQAPRWFWVGLQVGTTIGAAFIHWLIFESLYVIGALCPYCMVVWVVTIPLFWYTTLHNLELGTFSAGGRSAGQGLIRFHSFVLVLWFMVIAVLILQAFWSFWTS